jgi:hypothetical protein
LLVLSGPEDDDPGHAAIHYFDPEKNTVTFLGTLPELSAGGKPEGLLLLDDSGATYRVLVLSDGVDNGDPTEFVVPKKN